MEKNKVIYVKDFAEHPGLRYCSISDDSGEEFYHTVLNKEFVESYKKKRKLIINLDNTAGYAPSFLDEAFGNLIYDFGIEAVKETVDIISEQEPDFKDLIISKTYPQWQKRKEKGTFPKKTSNHKMWFKLKNGEIIEVDNQD